MLLDKFLSSYVQSTDYPTLDAMKFLMYELDHPEKKFKIIHVAGTNGKGSICEMINNILMLSNYKVGKFISPHLIESNESICINNTPMLDYDFVEYFNLFDHLSKKYLREFGRHLTRFEILTALALLYFAQNKCDIVILEVGLGGLYDCTNIVKPLVCAFGSIGFDHTAILGKHLDDIARQKAGIIKPNSNVVIFDQPTVGIFKQTAKLANANFKQINENEISNYSYDSNYQYFDYLDYKNLCINLKGKKQIENACVAIGCAEFLNENGFNIEKDKIYEGLKTVTHPARFEEISKEPLIIFDGAHNENAMKNFIETVDMFYKEKSKTFMVSIITTKDYKTVLEILLNHFTDANFIFTSGTVKDKFFDAEILYNYAKELNTSNNINIANFDEGIKMLNSDVNFIIGSFYTYEKTKKLLS